MKYRTSWGGSSRPINQPVLGLVSVLFERSHDILCNTDLPTSAKIFIFLPVSVKTWNWQPEAQILWLHPGQTTLYGDLLPTWNKNSDKFFKKLFLEIFISWVWMFYLIIYLYIKCMQCLWRLKVEFQTLMSSNWVLGFEVGPLEEEPVLWTADLTIYPQRHSF